MSHRKFHKSSASLIPKPSSPQVSIDNSMQKLILEKRKQKLYLDYLMKEKNRIIGRSEIRKMHDVLKQPKPPTSKKTEKILKRNQAAIKIQKEVRGWLVRKLYENDFILLRRKIASLQIHDLCQGLPALLLFGRNCLKAVLTIQKAYRYHKLRQKLSWLRRAYDQVIRNNAKAQAKRLARRYLRNCINKVKVYNIKEDIRRKESLFLIRRRLALCSIKNFLRKNGLSINDITLAYRVSRWAKLGISLLDDKNSQDEDKKRRPKLYSRVSFHQYKPVLSEKGSKSIEYSQISLKGASRYLEPTQASSSRTRIKYITSNNFHKRHQSEYSLYSKPTRPSTPYR